MRPALTSPPPAHLVTMRLVVTRTINGPATPRRRHQCVRALRRLVARGGTYTIDAAEVAGVRRVR